MDILSICLSVSKFRGSNTCGRRALWIYYQHVCQ